MMSVYSVSSSGRASGRGVGGRGRGAFGGGSCTGGEVLTFNLSCFLSTRQLLDTEDNVKNIFRYMNRWKKSHSI